MLDQIEYNIARRLSERHLYPYALDIYINIFKHFSHFPLRMKDINLQGPGQTITFIALVVLKCFQVKTNDFNALYKKVREELQGQAASFFPENIAVESFLGCMLYFYHPVDIRNRLAEFDPYKLFDEDQRYEFNLKKNTILIFTL
jgi:hypothetical protein